MRDSSDFSREISEFLASQPEDQRDTIVFLHGYNTNFAEGLYRHAQLQHDLGRHGASIHFSCPSAAKLTGYEYDRESALYSREALAETLDAVARSDAPKFNLAAHSMGNFLLMETLWVMAQGGNDHVFDKIGSVLLVSPDVEIDVFRKQAPAVLARGIPIYIVVSKGDRALGLSALIRGEKDRLGSIKSADELGGLDVTVIDLSRIESEDVLGHFKPATSPALIEFVKHLHASGRALVATGNDAGVISSDVAVSDAGSGISLEPSSASSTAQ